MTRSSIVCLLLSLVLVAASPAQSAQSAGQILDDTTLATRVKGALADSDLGSALDINVETYNGIVQLSGFVESESAEQTALAAARSVEGSKDVVDAIVVMTESRSAGQVVDDTTMQARLKTALTSSLGMSEAIAINTAVRNGEVLLAGFLDSADQVGKAVAAAEGIEGVVKVHNQIAVP